MLTYTNKLQKYENLALSKHFDNFWISLTVPVTNYFSNATLQKMMTIFTYKLCITFFCNFRVSEVQYLLLSFVTEIIFSCICELFQDAPVVRCSLYRCSANARTTCIHVANAQRLVHSVPLTVTDVLVRLPWISFTDDGMPLIWQSIVPWRLGMDFPSLRGRHRVASSTGRSVHGMFRPGTHRLGTLCSVRIVRV
jgi:hypothetical protein